MNFANLSVEIYRKFDTFSSSTIFFKNFHLVAANTPLAWDGNFFLVLHYRERSYSFFTMRHKKKKGNIKKYKSSRIKRNCAESITLSNRDIEKIKMRGLSATISAENSVHFLFISATGKRRKKSVIVHFHLATYES